MFIKIYFAMLSISHMYTICHCTCDRRCILDTCNRLDSRSQTFDIVSRLRAQGQLTSVTLLYAAIWWHAGQWHSASDSGRLKQGYNYLQRSTTAFLLCTANSLCAITNSVCPEHCYCMVLIILLLTAPIPATARPLLVCSRPSRLNGLLAGKVIRQQISITNQVAHQSTTPTKKRWQWGTRTEHGRRRWPTTYDGTGHFY